MKSASNPFTAYPAGSVRELMAISFPLILSILSSTAMSFFDRLILAKYSTEAMNAAVVAGSTACIFQYGAIGIASISEVFVGQYNGAQKHKKIGEPVWQMIWFSILTTFLFIPLGIFGGKFFLPQPEYLVDGIPYFKWSMVFGPVFCLSTALSSFFVGRGHLKLVTTIAILSNVLNIVLDYFLIFGVTGLFAPLGAKGAAMATGFAESFQVLILFWIFLDPAHRAAHGTGSTKFKPRLFWRSVRIGVPTSLTSVVELSAWSVLAQILTSTSSTHITVYSVGESFFGLFAFAFWGLQRGITTVVANYSGANREDMLTKVLFSGLKIIAVLILLLSIPTFFFPEKLIEFFLEEPPDLETQKYLINTLGWLWFYFMVDTISWLMSGTLTALGDTKFLMLMNSISVWGFYVLPVYISVNFMNGSPITCWVVSVACGLINTTCLFIRIKKKQASMQPLYV